MGRLLWLWKDATVLSCIIGSSVFEAWLILRTQSRYLILCFYCFNVPPAHLPTLWKCNINLVVTCGQVTYISLFSVEETYLKKESCIFFHFSSFFCHKVSLRLRLLQQQLKVWTLTQKYLIRAADVFCSTHVCFQSVRWQAGMLQSLSCEPKII